MKKVFINWYVFLIFSNIITLIILIVIIVFFWCPRPRCHDKVCQDNCYMPQCAPLPLLDKDLAVELVRNYRLNHWTAINTFCSSVVNMRNKSGDSCLIDSRAVWFSLDTLKMFINEIETNVCRNGCGNLHLGIRIYYGEYPDSADAMQSKFSVLPADFAGLHTLVMIPTCDINGIHTDFDPRVPLTGSCQHTSVTDTFDPTHVFGLKPALPTMSENHGEMIPPPFHVSEWEGKGAVFMTKMVDIDVPADQTPIARYDNDHKPIYCCK